MEWDEPSQSYRLNESASIFTEYTGPVSWCKESAQDKANREALNNAQTGATLNYYNKTLPWEQNMAQSQLDLQKQQTTAQMGFQNQYLQQQQQQFATYNDLMQKAYAKQSGISDQVTASMTPFLGGERGFSPSMMSTLNTQGMSNINSGYASAADSLKAQLLAHGEGGGGLPLSGTAIGNMANLQAGRANAVAGMRNTNQLTSDQQAQLNMFRAAGVMQGTAGQDASMFGTAAGAGSTALSGFGNMAGGLAGSIPTPGQSSLGAPTMATNPNTYQTPMWESMLGKVGSAALGGAGTLMTGGMQNWFPSLAPPSQ
jgi:hypothetical protein